MSQLHQEVIYLQQLQLQLKNLLNHFQAARAQERADQKQLDQAIFSGDVISEDFKELNNYKN